MKLWYERMNTERSNIEHDVKCVDMELEKPMKPILNQFHYKFKLWKPEIKKFSLIQCHMLHETCGNVNSRGI